MRDQLISTLSDNQRKGCFKRDTGINNELINKLDTMYQYTKDFPKLSSSRNEFKQLPATGPVSSPKLRRKMWLTIYQRFEGERFP